jgi:hypothetical protein
MHWVNLSFPQFRSPAEPAPPPVREPDDSPEHPDIPVQEPDPDDTHDI